MDKSTIALLSLTFLVGLFTGGYLYVTVFAPAYKSDVAASDQTNPNAIVIDGQMKGHCLETNACASFKISDDGSYSYLPYPTATVQKGALPDSLTKSIFTAVKTKDFFNDIQQLSYNACVATVRTTGFSYTVSFGSTSYVLDTCITNFANDTILQTTLGNVWIYLADSTKTASTDTSSSIFQKGLIGYFVDLFSSSRETTSTTSH